MADLREHALALEQLASSLERGPLPSQLVPGWPEQLRKTAALLRAGDSSLELAAAVTAMRSAQTNYFKTRDREVMRRSMELERRVDAMLSHGMKTPAAQGDLFGGGRR